MKVKSRPIPYELIKDLKPIKYYIKESLELALKAYDLEHKEDLTDMEKEELEEMHVRMSELVVIMEAAITLNKKEPTK